MPCIGSFYKSAILEFLFPSAKFIGRLVMKKPFNSPWLSLHPQPLCLRFCAKHHRKGQCMRSRVNLPQIPRSLLKQQSRSSQRHKLNPKNENSPLLS
tara:strand:- start:611 stop:901 length:291 start_codon:yes stop_codon:yes gene_type:complete